MMKKVTTESLQSRRYKTKYADDVLFEALESVVNRKMSEIAAAEEYGMYSVLNTDRQHGRKID
jgi:hypothetical protein